MPTTYPITIAPKQIAAFEDQGFVVTPDVINLDALAVFQEAVDQAVKDRTANDHRALKDKSRYEQSFIQCMRLWETHPKVASLSLDPSIAGIAAQLLNVKKLNLWQDQALYKEAGGQETTPHQDQPFWPIGPSPLISAWIPFDHVDAARGAMAYVPGSHKAGRLKVVDITHSTSPYDILRDPALNGAKPEIVEVAPGSIIWHHGMTVHLASGNQSTQTRRAFTIVYLDADAIRTKPWRSYPLDRAGVAVGDTVAGMGLPQVWPPLADPPEIPALIGHGTGPQ